MVLLTLSCETTIVELGDLRWTSDLTTPVDGKGDAVLVIWGLFVVVTATVVKASVVLTEVKVEFIRSIEVAVVIVVVAAVELAVTREEEELNLGNFSLEVNVDVDEIDTGSGVIESRVRS